MSSVELLAPAGNPEALDAAIGEGADAVYLGLRSFNARMRSANFAFSQFEAALDMCRKHAKKIYVTVNTVFEERESDRMYQLLQYLERTGPDGVIVQDLGVVKMVRDYFPSLRLHASTQMNVASSKGVNFLSRQGFKRVVLSRELSLDEIRHIGEKTNLEIEVFVHGALCVSASGLCLFSSYLGGKSANRGACTQACRRLYSAETQDGYFFSPDDLELVEHVPELMEAGVASFKIEGRMKSAEYVGTVTAAYRHMIDNWKLDRERALAKAQALLRSDFARRKTSFNITGNFDHQYIRPDQAGGTGIALGKIRDIRVIKDKRYALIAHADGLAEGDSLRIHRGDDSGRVTTKLRGIIEAPEGSLLLLDAEFRQSDELYLVQAVSMGRRYRPVLPNDLRRYRRFPSHDSAPRIDAPDIHRSAFAALPEGLYVLVGSVADLHVLNAARPTKAMILLSRESARVMRAQESALPFKRGELVIWLDPFFPEADAEWLAEEVEYWCSRGQKLWVANNLGHLGLLRGKECAIVAGPWLYAFNTRAAAFLLGEGASFIIPPMEISKQDFQRLAQFLPKAALMPVVFSLPQLFRIRDDLGKRYEFRVFEDRSDSGYELSSVGDGSTVLPLRPFSLIDRLAQFRKDGVGRAVIDLSRKALSKPFYKKLMRAAETGAVLPDASRFNWKDGFWQPESERGEPGSGQAQSSGERPAQRPGQGPGRRPRPQTGPRGSGR